MDGQHGERGGDAATEVEHGGAGGLSIKLDGKAMVVGRGADGRAVLNAGGLVPPDEHVLIEATRPGSRSVGLDERIGTASGAEFYAFRADRTFSFTIDGKGYEWGASKLLVTWARGLACLSDDMALFLKGHGSPDRELEDADEIDLGHGGTEHLRSAKGLVRVWIDGVEKEIPRGTYTTEQLITLLGVEAGYLLNVIDKDGQLIPLKPGETVKVKKGTKFISQVPCGGSS